MNIDAVAKRRISKLLVLAKSFWPGDKVFSKRYVQLARKIAMRHRIKLGNKLFCKKCDSIYIPGVNVRVRQSPSTRTMVYSCLECGAVRRFGY